VHTDDGAALALEGAHLVEALALEGLVADGEHLVDEEDLRLDVDGDGEPEPDVHARRIELDLVVDHPLDLVTGEVHDVVEPLGDLGPLETQQRAVEEDVLPPAEVGLEPGAELQQGGQAALGADLAGGRAEDARHALEQGGLA